MRPSSSLGISHRAPSRQSQARPSSSLSHGAPLRATPKANQPSSSRFDAKLAQLVTQMTGLTPDEHPKGFAKVTQSSRKIVQDLRYAGITVTTEGVDQVIRGSIEKAMINLKYDFAEALTQAYRRLKTAVAETQDQEDRLIKSSLLPEHVHFLISLSRAPEPSTYTYASIFLDKINNPQTESQLTWAQILADDPFEGEHWEGAYGLPPGAFTSKRRPSTPSTDSAEWSQLDQRSPVLSQRSSPGPASPIHSPELHVAPPLMDEGSRNAHLTREIVKELHKRQYWSNPKQLNYSTSHTIDPHNPSIFGISVSRALKKQSSTAMLEVEYYIREVDAVREVLLLLRGSESSLFEQCQHSTSSRPHLKVKERIPRLLHLSLSSYISLLSNFASTATALLCLKGFVIRTFKSTIFEYPSDLKNATRQDVRNQTLEAFAEAIELLTHKFEQWVAEKEYTICLAQNDSTNSEVIITLLSLQSDVQARIANVFDVLLEIVHDLESDQAAPNTMASTAATTSSFLLDNLISRVQSHFFMDNKQTACSLTWVFARASQPIWSMVGQWLKDGASLEQQTDVLVGSPSPSTEFFLQRAGVSVGSPEFWEEGYTVKQSSMVPLLFEDVAPQVLSVGKAVGLIRALGLDSFFRDGTNSWMSNWPTFAELAAFDLTLDEYGVKGSLDFTLSRVSVETLGAEIREYLSPFFQIAHNRLNRVLVEECQLWQHLESIEDLFLMGRGDTISYFADMVFENMQARQMWRDYHFLNTTFREAIEASHCPWIDTSLIRLSYRSVKSQDATRTVKIFEGLLLEYRVPFPLTYLFGPASMQVYSSVFSFLMQIRRAKGVLDRLALKGAAPARVHKTASEMKGLYVMRGKLSWFINMLLNFVMTNVLHAKVLKLHISLKNAKSLDDMIQIHHSHLQRLESQCILRPTDINLRQTITSILDLALTFTDMFNAFTADTSMDASRSSLVILPSSRPNGRRARPRISRFKRRQQRNYVGFAEDLPPESSSEGESSDEDRVPAPLLDVEDSGPDADVTVPFSEETFKSQLKAMELKLDEYVRFIRRSVDVLTAQSTSEDDTIVFGVLSFALQDWDL